MKLKSESGLILLSVLFFLQVFSLLSLSGFMFNSLITKKVNISWQTNVQILKANAILWDLEKTVQAVKCGIPVTPATTLTTKPLNWWQMHACHFKQENINYFYTIESLFLDVCGKMGEFKVAHYYRITLYILSDKLTLAKYFLQTTIALAENTNRVCKNKPHKVAQGRQMWREI